MLVMVLPLAILPEQRARRCGEGGHRNDGERGQPGGNMEGKEVRFGIAESALFGGITTAFTTGSVNAMHDSFTPLVGMGPWSA